MMQTEWMTGASGDKGAAEMDRVTGGIYMADPGVVSPHRILNLISHLIPSPHLIIQ